MRPARLRVFAGPNGSGKTTIKRKIFEINPKWLGVHINPDDIEREVSESGYLNFDHFKVTARKAQVFQFLKKATQLTENNLRAEISRLEFSKNSLSFQKVSLNSYLVSAIADFLHERLVAERTSFSFETVMSHPNKIDLLAKAHRTRFRNYLYYVATEDPEINVSRVRIRVKEGGRPRNRNHESHEVAPNNTKKS